MVKAVNRKKMIDKSDVKENRLKELSLFYAPPRKLMWIKIKKHKLAVISGIFLIFLYLIAIFCEFFSPYDPNDYDANYLYAPPQKIRFISKNGFHLRPVVFGYIQEKDPVTLRRKYKPDPDKIYPIHFFVKGKPYTFLGLFETGIHLFGVNEGTIFLLGTDRNGRDMLSRIIYGTRISTSIGLAGVIISFILGIVIGGIAGFFGGIIDSLIQRIIEFMRSIPTLPLWMGLSAALPPHLPTTTVYLGITIILSIVGWTGLARVVRSKFLSLREEDFVIAAKVIGAKRKRIIFRHMLPNFTSHIIASMTLAVPRMILGETALSFLGLGIRAPAISWGILLQEAQNVRSVALFPWLLLPGVAVIITVLAFNFIGDGLRDAADPYST